MKQFQLKTLIELTSEEQQHIVAGSSASDCGTCTCGDCATCSCSSSSTSASVDGAKQDSRGNTKSLNKSAGD